MTENRLMKLWTAIVTAVLALCTTLGLITTTAAAATRTEPVRAGESATPAYTADRAAASPGLWSQARSLPPTMKQRIRAEAHGKSPSCRHRGLPDAEQTEQSASSCEPADPAEPAVPLQR